MTVYNNIILIIYSNEMVHQSDGLSPLMEVLISDTRFVAVSHSSYLFLLPELSWVLIFNGRKIEDQTWTRPDIRLPVLDSSVVGSRNAELVEAVTVVFDESGNGSSLERMEEEEVTQARSVPNEGTNSDGKKIAG